MKQNLRKWGIIFLAMNLVGLAVALFLENRLGSDSIGLLCDGISRAADMQYGNASLLYNLLIITLALFTARKNIGAGTIVYALCSGYFIDFYLWLLGSLDMGSNPFLLRFLGFAAGEICLCLALALLIQLKLGMNALDAFLCKMEECLPLPYSVLRTGTDILYVLLGTVLGGTFGVGTICSVLVTGFLVSKFTELLHAFETRSVFPRRCGGQCTAK